MRDLQYFGGIRNKIGSHNQIFAFVGSKVIILYMHLVAIAVYSTAPFDSPCTDPMTTWLLAETCDDDNDKTTPQVHHPYHNFITVPLGKHSGALKYTNILFLWKHAV